MIFVSYCREDETWRRRFETISKPLSRVESIRFWSDKEIKAGPWEPQIEAAMKGAVAAVLMVSPNFLASDYIIQKELPFLLRANATRGLMIFWAFLEPCDIKRYPKITRFQAMTLNKLEPMSKLNTWEWQQTMLHGCDMIDRFLKELERPVINPAVVNRAFPNPSAIKLLAEPARRPVEVLVYSAGKKWWRQAPIATGACVTKIHLGNNDTIKGAKFSVVAMTTEEPLTQQTYLNLPDYRERSKEFRLIRG